MLYISVSSVDMRLTLLMTSTSFKYYKKKNGKLVVIRKWTALFGLFNAICFNGLFVILILKLERKSERNWDKEGEREREKKRGREVEVEKGI